MALLDLSSLQLLLLTCAAYTSWWAIRAAYRLWFHPLARYPGPKLAAISTSWFEYWWNVRKPGCMLFEIGRLHANHGPVIRIGVNDLHVDDPEFFVDSTNIGSKFTKDEHFYRGISLPHTSIGGIDPDEHRIRRAVLGPAFTASRITEITPLVQEHIEKLSQRLDEYAKDGTPVNMAKAMKSLTLDVISKIVFGEEFGALASQDFHHPQLDVLHQVVQQAWVLRAFPLLGTISLSLPQWLARRLFPIPIDEFAQQCQARIDNYLELREQKRLGHSGSQKAGRKDVSVVLEVLLDANSAKGHRVLTAKELNDEALMLLTAGNDTTSNAMILGLYYICKHSRVHEKLVNELRNAFGNRIDVSLDEIKKLPYLTAVIKEVLRYSNPIPGRLPRVVPPGGYELYGSKLVPGTVIHTSAYLLNRHPSVWSSNAEEFIPERWLDAASSTQLSKYMASFQRGTRQCLGINLAWCELWLLFATIFLRFDISLVRQSETDTKAGQIQDDDMDWSDHLLMLFKNDLYVRVAHTTEN